MKVLEMVLVGYQFLRYFNYSSGEISEYKWFQWGINSEGPSIPY